MVCKAGFDVVGNIFYVIHYNLYHILLYSITCLYTFYCISLHFHCLKKSLLRFYT